MAEGVRLRCCHRQEGRGRRLFLTVRGNCGCNVLEAAGKRMSGGGRSRVFAFLPLEEGSVGTYHPRFEEGHHAIRSEMMRAHHADCHREERLVSTTHS